MNRAERRQFQRLAYKEIDKLIHHLIDFHDRSSPCKEVSSGKAKRALERAMKAMVATRELQLAVRITDEAAAAFPSYVAEEDPERGKWYLAVGLDAEMRMTYVVRKLDVDARSNLEEWTTAQAMMLDILSEYTCYAGFPA